MMLYDIAFSCETILILGNNRSSSQYGETNFFIPC